MGNCNMAKHNEKLIITPLGTGVGKVNEVTKASTITPPLLPPYVLFNYSKNLEETIDRYTVTYNCKIIAL